MLKAMVTAAIVTLALELAVVSLIVVIIGTPIWSAPLIVICIYAVSFAVSMYQTMRFWIVYFIFSRRQILNATVKALHDMNAPIVNGVVDADDYTNRAIQKCFVEYDRCGSIMPQELETAKHLLEARGMLSGLKLHRPTTLFFAIQTLYPSIIVQYRSELVSEKILASGNNSNGSNMSAGN